MAEQILVNVSVALTSLEWDFRVLSLWMYSFHNDCLVALPNVSYSCSKYISLPGLSSNSTFCRSDGWNMIVHLFWFVFCKLWVRGSLFFFTDLLST